MLFEVKIIIHQTPNILHVSSTRIIMVDIQAVNNSIFSLAMLLSVFQCVGISINIIFMINQCITIIICYNSFI